MCNKKLCATFLLLSLFSSSTVYAGSNFSYEKAQPRSAETYIQKPLTYSSEEPLRGSVVMVPAGVEFPAMLTSDLSSATATVGSRVTMLLSKDFYYDNKLIAPSGSTVSGTVIEASSAKHGSINGKLCVRFTEITTPVGVQIPISAVIKTNDSSGLLVGGTKKDVAKEYTKDLAIGSAAGALSGVVFGALAGGSIGKGAALGTAVGAGGGLVKSAIDKGNDVEIPANAGVELMLLQPITTSASNYSYEN